MDARSAFLHEPMLPQHFFVNAPNARTRREASLHYQASVTFLEPQLPLSSSETIIHQIGHPGTASLVINRQVVLESDNKIRKSVRIGRSNLWAEKEALELIQAKTSIPVPQVYEYYKTVEFEHLVIENMPGITLEKAWPELDMDEKEKIADEIMAYVGEMRKLQSPDIKAALHDRKPLRSGLVDAGDFIRERFAKLPTNKNISAYIEARISDLPPQANVYTHCDLDWSNILVKDGKVSAIIDWELSGYFPAFWEYMVIKYWYASPYPPEEGSWFHFLATRLASLEGAQQWEGM